MRVFSYKIARDFGFAPNPFKNICTLATCKPQIRKQAQVGDLIVGCGSAELTLVGKVIFAMLVSEKLTFTQYWDDPRFLAKRPFFGSSIRRMYGDNIYHKAGVNWIQEDSHHSLDFGQLNVANLRRDTSADSVLVGHDFVYWGANAIDIPAALRNFNDDDVYPHARSHRSIFADDFLEAIFHWYDSVPVRGIQGRPASWN